jgi:hypothetical protein
MNVMSAFDVVAVSRVRHVSAAPTAFQRTGAYSDSQSSSFVRVPSTSKAIPPSS